MITITRKLKFTVEIDVNIEESIPLEELAASLLYWGIYDFQKQNDVTVYSYSTYDAKDVFSE